MYIIMICVQNAFLRMRNRVCYKLVGIVMHHTLGKVGGHYTCYILDPGQKQWFHANDDKVIRHFVTVHVLK